MTTGTGTEEYYQRRAPEYDRVYVKPERQADLGVLRPLVRERLTGRRVLEVAAGTGWWTDVYGDAADSVVASDVNEATLEVARARRDWPSSVRFGRADAFALDTLAGDFDAAFAGFFWSHLPLDRIDTFLDGLARRVGRGGRLVFVDNRYVDGSNYPVTRRDADGNTFQNRWLGDGTEWEVLKNFPSTEEIEGRLGRIGASVSVRLLPYYWLADCQI